MRLIISFIEICRWRCWLRNLGGDGMGVFSDLWKKVGI